jgi:protease IV
MNRRTFDIAQFAASVWMIEPGAGQSVLASLLAGSIEVDVPEEPVVYEFQSGYFPAADYPNSVAVVSFSGVIWAEWSISYEMEQLRRIAADPNVAAVVLKLNSPGGSVDAGDKFARFLATYPKPIVAYIDYGMAVSCGYMLACSCRAVVASRDRDRVGGIGVYISWMNMKAYFEKQGIVVKDIYARQSTEKNADARAAEKGNYTPLEDAATESAQAFIDYVAERRTLTYTDETDPMTGRLFTAGAAVPIGLIDAVGTLDAAIAKARQLVDSERINQDSDMIAGFVRLAALHALAGLTAEDVTEAMTTALTDELAEKGYNVVVGRVADLEAANATLAENNRLKAELATAQATVATLTKEKGDLQAEVTRLGNLPGGTTTNPQATENTAIGGDGVEDWKKTMDGMAHYQDLDARLG